MDYIEILDKASQHLNGLIGESLDVLEIAKPETLDYAIHLSKTVSKLSPLVGNMIEFKVCEELNKHDWGSVGKWLRQDPGFPDTIFSGDIFPTPGIEIKTWFPLATEITARFKDSINHFKQNQVNVALVAWVPEFLIYGKPKIIDIWIGSAQSLAEARDKHYHKPPGYLVFEPEDTSLRTINLQQTNTNGYKFQGTIEKLSEAIEFIAKMENSIMEYSPEFQFQQQLKAILNRFPYRLDTNFAKIDRIKHSGLEVFKKKVLNFEMYGNSLKNWSRSLANGDEISINYLKNQMSNLTQSR